MSEAREFLVIEGLTKRYGGKPVLTIDHMAIDEGEFFTVVGPSGSGKSTLLSAMTGATPPTAGQVWLRGSDITDLPADRRPTAMVFQSLALFPHMSVGLNIEFPLKVRGVPARERRERCHALLDQLRLGADFYDRAISQCSGGERQRIAIARSLAYDPDVLFFDEPLSSIDYRLRKTLEVELKEIHRRTGKTFIYVTHSLEEAMVMSDRIAIMRAGEIIQIDTPESIYLRPADRFVANFLGETNIFPVRRAVDGESFLIETGNGAATPPTIAVPDNAGVHERGYVIIRPECMHFVEGRDDVENVIEVCVRTEYLLGSRMRYAADLEGLPLIVERIREEGAHFERDQRVLAGWRNADSYFVSE